MVVGYCRVKFLNINQNLSIMKRTKLILGLAFAAIIALGFTPSMAFAQDMQDATQIQNDQVEEITESDLPDAVAQAWEDKKSDADQVSKVYKITSADGTERYRIEYVDASSQSQYVEFDADGNEI